ncbi:MAG: hypothetical protein M3N43_10910 [Actinomycetota bacterium]|nr:hypothetical protein [Actinomycetota bacterium]
MTGAPALGRTGARRSSLAQVGRLLAVGCGLLAVGSCNEIAGPIRGGGYGFTLIVSDTVVADTTIDGVFYAEGDTITDTVAFSWPESHIPIRIWVHDTNGLPEDIDAGIALWEDALLFGEIAAVRVSDSATAHIIVKGTPAPPEESAPHPARRLAAALPACEGATDVLVSAPDHTKLWLPVRVYVIPTFVMTDTVTTNCLKRVTAHELGHALGLFRHSIDLNNLMFGFPEVDAPSEVDATTILRLYHTQADLRPAIAPPTVEDTTTTPPDSTPPDTMLLLRRRN